jgi:hypothetical protein
MSGLTSAPENAAHVSPKQPIAALLLWLIPQGIQNIPFAHCCFAFAKRLGL